MYILATNKYSTKYALVGGNGDFKSILINTFLY